MPKTVVYTCAIGNYDWIHRPQIKPAGIDFLRFSDRRPLRPMGWKHRELPSVSGARTARVASRFPKLRPQAVLPDYDIAVWIDSSVEVRGDITPLIELFDRSDADVALFPHPSGRTVNEEIDFAIGAKKIMPEMHYTAGRQRDRYASANVLDRKIVEASIIFYKLTSDQVRKASEIWWDEIINYTERDQISQPYAMRNPDLKIYLWDWHFNQENPYFRRLPHRPMTLAKRLKTGAYFLGDVRLDYRLVRLLIACGKVVRHAQRSLFTGT